MSAGPQSPSRFGPERRSQLASYVGFAPSPFQSGNVAHDQGISKAGNRKGRTTGIELAWLFGVRGLSGHHAPIWWPGKLGRVLF
jgi:transposase